MPINTSSTGATYGKSSDPLCPLGFHPQVRWPTRCKRCFRDYKEHSDSADQKKYGNLSKSNSEEDDPWTARKSQFQKSKSVDVSLESGASARLASYSALASAAGVHSKAEEDIPEWKKAMLARRQERERQQQIEDEETSAAAKARNFGFIPGTSLHSSYANKSYESDSRLSSWGSSSNLRGSYSNLASATDEADSASTASSYRRQNSSTPSRSTASTVTAAEKAKVELSPYEKYLQRKKEQEMKDEEERRRADEEKKEAERRRAREEERRREEETAERERARKREREREQKRLEEERKAKEEEKRLAEEKEKKASASSGTRKWGAKATTPDLGKSTTPTKTGPGASKSAAATSDEKAVTKRKPWEKPSAAAAKSASTLPSLNESSGRQNSNRKNSESDSESNSLSGGRSSTGANRLSTSTPTHGHYSDSDHECSTKTELESIKSELQAVKSRNDVLERIHNDKSGSSSMTLDSAKASEATAELLKAREKVREQETTLSSLNKDKKALNLKVKELESALERRPQVSETQKTISELQTKLKYMEKKCSDLGRENDDLRGNVQNLEVELEEVQDNFREDEADEYRSLKRELENSAKNCRVLQFKLKKAEKALTDVSTEKSELESKMKSLSGGSSALDNLNKIRNLEKELEAKNMQVNRLEADVRNAKSAAASNLSSGPRKGGPGPCLSRTGSVERNVEDQLLKDLQDSIERENDLKEQLNMAEEESGETRKKLSRLEDENESLSNQVKRMTLKTKSSRRSPSPYNKTSSIEKDEGISEDGEELTPAELKVQLEVSEGETALLRKKVENLLTENLKVTKEVKDLTTKLNDEKKKKSSTSAGGGYGSLSAAKSGSSASLEQKVSELQADVNTFRIKLIEKDREIERLDAQVKANKSGKTLKRTGSQDEDLLKKLNVIEKEAEVLRNKTSQLEAENEALKTDKGKGGGYGAKSSAQGKLEMDKFALEEKVKSLDNKLKEANKKITELEDTGKSSMKTNLEVDRLKRDKTSLEAEVTKLKDTGSSDKRKMDKLERDLAAAVDKAEKGQREIIAAEREKRKIEDERSRLESQMSRLETDIRSLNKERDRYKEESETARQKNRENLTQTQEGMKAFKDQIETLKMELGDEKRANRELKRQGDDRVRSVELDCNSLKREMERKASDVDEKARKIKDLEEKVADIEDKWGKSKRINQQRKDKIEKLEAQLESNTSGYGSSTSLQNKLETAETRIAELEKELAETRQGGAKSWELNKLKREIDNLKSENKKLSEQKGTKSSNEDYETLKGELTTLRQTYNNKSDEWIKEKLELERQVKELEASIRSSAGNGWDAERNRFKAILDDRDSQITNLKIECDVANSQHLAVKKELEDQKQKLADYEKMNRYGRSANDSGSTSDTAYQLEELKKQLSNEQKERKSDVNNTKMKYDSKIAIMAEELHALKSQAAKYRRERETYKEMFEGVQKKLTDAKGGKIDPGESGSTAADLNEARNKISDMSYQMHVIEDELSDAKMEAAKAHANMTALKSNYDIQISELNSKINELEEESLIDSGRARIAGTRTKMELAWQKERESQKKLINELNTMARDLKNTLLEVEKEKERERLDSKRKIDAMKRAFDEEQDDTKKQITDLQYDLLELRDAHAKLRTTNEKLRRDKERSVDDIRMQSKTRSEHGEDRKVARLIKDMEDFLLTVPKLLGDDIMEKEERGRTSRLDSEKSLAKMEFKTALHRVKETKEELEQIHKISEEEVRRRSMKRGESVETFAEDSPARGRSGLRNASHSASSQKRALYRKAVSVGDSIPEGNSNIWQSKESLGSNESMASNASIPLPIPVRTRSTRGGSESGYSSDTYNAMTIKRLERDTSVDRLSTGSKESTQSEWLPGEKKKSKGLLGKLKKIGRSMSTERTNESEREFGSGSDISSVSQASKVSTASKMSSASKIIQRARSASKDRQAVEKAEKNANTVANANKAFDKYFDKSGGLPKTAAGAARPVSTAGTPGARSTASTSSNSSTLPRTYRRY